MTTIANKTQRMPVIRTLARTFLIVTLPLGLILGCGGGGGGGGAADNEGNGNASNGGATSGELFVGYYAEDPKTNPEDPTEGALFLNVPSGSGTFSGAFSFTFYGCQTSNVGIISGTKTALSLEGQWSGRVDESPQSGFFQGDARSGSSAYAGTYTVNGGKQFLVVPGCISYYIAPNGSWELFRVGETYASVGNTSPPVEFVEYEALWHNIAWTPPQGTVRSSVFIVDADLALADAEKAIVWQSIVPGQVRRAMVPFDAVLPGRRYVAGVASTDGVKLLYFSTAQFSIGQQETSEPGKNGTEGDGAATESGLGSITLSGTVVGNYTPAMHEYVGIFNTLGVVWWGDGWRVGTDVQRTGTQASVVTILPPGKTHLYECFTPDRFGFAQGDCSGVRHDHVARTVTFSDVLVIGPAYGEQIRINGRLSY